MAITVTVDSKEVQATLNRLRQSVENLRPAMQGIGQAMRSAIQQNLKQSVSPWGEPFKPLKFRQGTPLYDTRQHIYNKITYRANESSVAVGMLDSQAAKVGKVHQFGAVIKHAERKQTLNFKVNMKTGKSRFAKQGQANFAQDVTIKAHSVTIPARPFMPIRPDGRADLPPEWERKVIEVIEKKINGLT